MAERRDPDRSAVAGRVAAFRSMPRWARTSSYVAAALVLVLVLTAVAGSLLVRRPLPTTEGSLALDGLTSEVEVLRDGRGVAQLYADDADDLFFAQGFVHAQDRFWQMDVRRHLASGRLAELVGEDGVDSDRVIRTLGLRGVAERELDLLSPATLSYLESYSAGVNAWLAERDLTELGVEYALLSLRGLDQSPTPWTPVDSLAWLKAQAWEQQDAVELEISRTRIALSPGGARTEELFPDFPFEERRPVVPGLGGGAAAASASASQVPPRPGFPGSREQALEERLGDTGAEDVRRAMGEVHSALEAVPALTGRGEGLGSNAWAVAGQHTASGEALLAADPHHGVGLPGVWHQVGLHCRTVSEACPFDVGGFGQAGVPGVMAGRTSEVAWGSADLGADTADLFLERIQGSTYVYDGERLPLQEREETIRVAGGEEQQVTVRSTRNGPLLSDASMRLAGVGANTRAREEMTGERGRPGEEDADALDPGGAYGVSLAWTALTPGPTLEGILDLNRATGWGEFREAAAKLATPGQGLVYADRGGNIGFQAAARVPIRGEGSDGRLPTPGWESAQGWTGETVPAAQLPRDLNPEGGIVVAANQAVAGPRVLTRLGTDVDPGYRSQRIRELLEERIAEGPVLDVGSMEQIQADTRSAAAPVLVPYLLRQLLPSEYEAAGQRLLVDWDYSQPTDSAAAAYFNAVWRNVLELTFHDDLPESQWPDGGARWVAVLEDLLEQPGSPWWDDTRTAGVIEDRDTVLATAMRRARDDLTRAISVNPRRWTWGGLHELELRHDPLGGSDLAPLRLLLDRGPFAAPGGSAAVDAAAWDAAEGFEMVSGATMRMVVDLADPDGSRWVALGGQSGHPASPHYRDQVETLLAGRSLPWPQSVEAVRASTEQRLVLRPLGPVS